VRRRCVADRRANVNHPKGPVARVEKPGDGVTRLDRALPDFAELSSGRPKAGPGGSIRAKVLSRVSLALNPGYGNRLQESRQIVGNMIHMGGIAPF
jgi:hypothetical protein